MYKVSFTSVCFGKNLSRRLERGKKVRLFYRGSGAFNHNTVHEEFETSEEIGSLQEEIFHHSYVNLEDYFTKFNRYTTEGAKDAFQKEKIGTLKIILEPFINLFGCIFQIRISRRIGRFCVS